MIELTPIFQERVERGMRFREYFYISVLTVFSAYQLSGIGGTPGRVEILIYFVATVLFMLVDRKILSTIRKGRGTDWFTIISVGKDIFLMTFFIHLTGGIESPFIFLYFLVAIGVGAAMGFIYGLYVLITISLSFFLLVYMEYTGFIQHHSQNYFIKAQTIYKNIFVLVMVTFEIFLLGILAIFSNRYIVKRLRMRERELASKVEEIDKINKQIEDTNAELINLTNQIELQKENLERSNRLQKILYDITSLLVVQYPLEVLIKKIHIIVSNFMPVLSCCVLIKRENEIELESISSSDDFIINDEIKRNFEQTIELNDIFIKGVLMFFPLKKDKEHVIVMVCHKDPQSRQLREEEIKILFTIAKQIGFFIDRLNLYQKLQLLSNTDGLTGLYNHRFFHIRLEEEIAKSRRTNKPLSLIIMDMDNFKEVNDRYGHQEGDRVLNFIAGIIKGGCRNSDTLARYGGDEFVIILPETDCITASHIAKRIYEKIKSTDIQVPGNIIHLSMCMGISCMSEENLASAREIVTRADTALYEAKKSGAGTIKVF